MSNTIRSIAVGFVGLALVLAFDAISDDTSPKAGADKAVKSDTAHAPDTAHDPKAGTGDGAHEVELSACIPVYRPPKLGKPRMTVGGGSRGPGKGFPALYVIVPDHVGQTTSSQPSLFWFVDEVPPLGTQFVFTLMDEEADTPLIEEALGIPERSGLQRVRISDFGVQLETGTEYQWSIAMSAPGVDHSKDVISVGWIDYVGKSDGIAARLEAGGPERSSFVYAEEGIWYDALSSIHDSMESNSGAMDFKVARVALLEAAGLDAVAAHVGR